MKVHFISGLGADERVFQYLELPGIERIYIKWERPLKKESLSNYAQRLLVQIDPSGPPILVGMSFGGLVAQEIAKLIPCRLVILIASVKSQNEYDWKLKWVKQTHIYKIIPASLLKWSNRFTADYYFGTQTKDESRLLHQIIKDTDPWFLTWAVEKIMTWENASAVKALVHIHGDKDRIFASYNLSKLDLVPDAGHFMIVGKSKEVSFLIMKYLSAILDQTII